MTVIAPVSESSMPAELVERLRPRVERLGYLGGFFTHTAHHPQALLSFLEFSEEAKRPLDPRVVEVVALTVATFTGNDYELNQHERLSIALGFERDWIARIEALRPLNDATMTPAEAAVQRLAIAMIERFGRATSDELADVVELVAEKQAIAVLFLVGRYITHSLVVNALGLVPPVERVLTEDEVDAHRV